MKRKILVVATILMCYMLQAKEGMWIPLLVEQLNYDDLKTQGFKLSAADIYNMNQASLTDAVVLFGRGCTGEVVSDNGLLFTNHHCGFGQIQKHSSIEHNYLRTGFWAMNQKEELPNPGLTVKFLVGISPFTDIVLDSIDSSLPYYKQKPLIDKRISKLEKAIEDTSSYKASIESFFVGNEYYLFLYKEYSDIRLVGAPPVSIGSFGRDPDNWVWPRHTGDFSVFRIYTGPNGEPATYSEDNIPLKPKKHLTINAKGIQPGDFTMVLGYPARTKEYIYSQELELIKNNLYPARIAARNGRLEIIDKARANDENIYIKYASKQKGISNAWKKWRGVLYGFEKFDVIEKRKAYEKELLSKAGKRKAELEELYQMFEETYTELTPYVLANDLFKESITAIEPFNMYEKNILNILNAPEELKDFAAIYNRSTTFFKDYDFNVDKQLTKFLLNNFLGNTSEEFHPSLLSGLKNQESLNEYIDKIYGQSVLTDKKRFESAVAKAESGNSKPFLKDPLIKLYKEFILIYLEEIEQNYKYYQGQIDNLNQEYILLIQKIDTQKPIYPDANFTMRLSYGKVEAYSPGDAVEYGYQTYLEGVMQKESEGHEDYVVSDKLKKLYETKDYGKYAAENKKLPVCFIASNHTSGGNSGSPVLNDKGQLIGLNFDRTWEGTMSDFNFDEAICRNISVDIRYVLFVIDKFAEAGYLLDEMDIVW